MVYKLASMTKLSHYNICCDVLAEVLATIAGRSAGGQLNSWSASLRTLPTPSGFCNEACEGFSARFALVINKSRAVLV